MAQVALRQIIMGLATTAMLMGCVQGAGPGAGSGTGLGTDAAAPTNPARAAKAGEVEAPEIFQANESALWDGRPSLGGIWVASPEAKDPERVVMFNAATGKTVQGALFRRERENPGPRLQVSSDAAEALGILAGQPVELRVTALRRVEPEPAPEPAPAPAPETAPTDGAVAADPASPEVATDATSDSDAAATAAAATAALAATGASVGAVVAEGATTADAAIPDADGQDVTAAETTLTDPPKRKTWKERRAEAKAAREAKKAAAAAAAGDPIDGTAAILAEEAPATAEGVAVEAVAVTAIEAAPLDASAPATVDPETTATEVPADVTEVAPVAEPPKTRRQRRAEEAAAKAAAEEAEAAAAAAAAATTVEGDGQTVDAPDGRAIQVASFTKEPNADRAVEALAKIGIEGETRKIETNGKTVWAVVTTGDDAKLKAIKGFGFADAFFM